MDKTIRKMMPTDLKNIYKSIELDFAVGEYAPYDVLAKQLEKGVQKGYIFRNSEKDVGYSICADGCANGFILISLLSVHKEFRGNGFGSTFLEELIRSYSMNQGVIVEVEKPENSRSDEERALCEKRIRFYQGAGFHLIPDIDYSIWDVPMHLMGLPLKASEDTLNEMIGQIMHEIYLELMGKRYIHKLKFSRVNRIDKMKEVTAAIILKDNKILIAQRAPADNLAGKWEFPGGKIEPGETPKECLKREIREELDVEIEVSDFFGESIYMYNSGTIKLMAFWCKWISGDFRLKVHSQIAWLNLHEFDLYDFAPADLPLVEKLKAGLS